MSFDVKKYLNRLRTEASQEAEDDEIAIRVTNLTKSFKLPTERAWGLKQAIFNRLKGIKGYKKQVVLSGIDFEVKKGEFLGIVGRNGSGKSTLLKLLAGIYVPDSGKIMVNGSLVPFIELGVGFNPELTGRENIYLNGALLGFSNAEVDKMYDEIVKFAELEDFMDQKLKNYSSGMQVRLAFSIAIRAKGDILVLDEVLAVGDAAFQEKCNNYFASLRGNQTVILVTHDMSSVERFCDRAILIEQGKILTSGKPEKVTKAYQNLWN
ncbi:MAG: ABC transporter ATP-binding protein [Candidatus Saccharibacteria bacterium]|nr:ABC transporter ATP-binding protein [Candidatus Saccharibacteria bacterium]